MIHTPWEEREGWRDIKPLQQDDPPNALCKIAYHPDYRNPMDAFRYLVSIDEKSPRVLELTEAIVRMNPSHYSVWAYRGECLLEIKADLSKELDLMDELIKLHLKSYQVWQHRRIVVQALGDPSRELGFISRALAIDSKNYHTWAYRQWVLCEFWGIESLRPENEKADLWAGELAFAESMLTADIRNNSAWNHRFFVVFECGMTPPEKGDVVERELSYTKDKIQLVPSNASAWNYLRGILKRSKGAFSDHLPFVRPLASGDSPPFLAVEFEADALAESSDEATRQEAAKLYDRLGSQLDPIRASFYRFRKRQALG